MSAVSEGEAGDTSEPWAAPGSDGPPDTSTPPGPGSWLRSIAASVARALAEGAHRERDPDGWLVLVRPNGRQTMVASHIVASLAEAGLLPPLPPEQEADTSGLGCPPSWSEPSEPPRGAWCWCCGRFTQRGGRWWHEADRLGWCCWTCHPPDGLPATAIVELRT
ncbi:hypothetical protein [Belnapia rosea]|uniref:hypothetical protein n=1 Tax=Belnapia rosea TaxID=938405 RepID=UPI00115FD740|nr:hypothetical protein [Belnapia rosea]